MPVNSISFNRFLGLMLGLISLNTSLGAELPPLNPDDIRWLGEKIYQNECNSRYECLTSWNAGEDFPSLGIGHFIWYQQGQSEVFEETFPDLLEFIQSKQVELPIWLAEMASYESPWPTRTEFLDAQQSPQLNELRQFLFDTRTLQAEFIARRLTLTLDKLLDAAEVNSRQPLRENFDSVLKSNSPYGLYALIDYLHFKGSGLNESERYNQQGWGLLQVLLAMESSTGVTSFVEAAQRVLTNRVANAPPQRKEQRWLKGWKNRLQTYLETPPSA